jgi:hypothetical protein
MARRRFFVGTGIDGGEVLRVLRVERVESVERAGGVAQGGGI